jgi:hypothetical protein
LQNNTLSATQNFFNTPDIASLVQCFPQLKNAVSNSLVAQASASGTTLPPAPLPAVNAVSALTVSSC